jgi:Ser/Thr protein kinase RdoA (MazF antagonist)
MPDDPDRPRPSEHARRVAPAFGLDPDRLEFLDALVAEVLVADGPDGPVVLKVMDPGHRSVEEAQAEIDWQRALLEAGIPVARPLRARDGTDVVVAGDPPRIAVAYRRSPGRHLEPAEWTPDRFEAHGRLLGRMQAHARRWRLPAGRRRDGWLDHRALERAPEALPGDGAFLEAAAEVATRVRAEVPTPDDHVGLIHADLHAWNVLVDEEGGLTAIDFDDTVIGPYLYDLAIPLYYAVTTRRDQDPGAVAEAFLEPFLAGFDAIAPRPPGGADGIAALLAMRQCDLAIFVHLEVPPERWDDELRAAATRLRDRTATRHEVVPIDVLRRHFG